MKLSNEDAKNVLERLKIASGREIVVVEMAGRKRAPGDGSCRNIFCVDADNEIYWRVSPNKTHAEPDNFVGIEQDGDRLKGITFFGWEYKIDLSSGAATMTGWRK